METRTILAIIFGIVALGAVIGATRWITRDEARASVRALLDPADRACMRRVMGR